MKQLWCGPGSSRSPAPTKVANRAHATQHALVSWRAGIVSGIRPTKARTTEGATRNLGVVVWWAIKSRKHVDGIANGALNTFCRANGAVGRPGTPLQLAEWAGGTEAKLCACVNRVALRAGRTRCASVARAFGARRTRSCVDPARR